MLRSTHQHVEEHDEQHDGVGNHQQHGQPGRGKRLQHLVLKEALQSNREGEPRVEALP